MSSLMRRSFGSVPQSQELQVFIHKKFLRRAAVEKQQKPLAIQGNTPIVSQFQSVFLTAAPESNTVTALMSKFGGRDSSNGLGSGMLKILGNMSINAGPTAAFDRDFQVCLAALLAALRSHV